MIAAALERTTEEYREALWPALTATGTAAERLETALRALCGAADQHLLLLASLYPHPHTPFHQSAGDQPALVREPFAEPFERLLRDGAADGTLRAEDPAKDATGLFNLVAWTHVHLRHAHDWDADDTVEPILRRVLPGLRP